MELSELELLELELLPIPLSLWQPRMGGLSSALARSLSGSRPPSRDAGNGESSDGAAALHITSCEKMPSSTSALASRSAFR